MAQQKATQRDQDKVQAKKESGHGHISLLESVAECFGVPKLRSYWSIKAKQNEVLLSSMRYTKKKTLGGRGRLLITRIDEGGIAGPYLCDSRGSYLGYALTRGASVNSRPLQATWLKRLYAEVYSSAKLSTILFN